MGRKKWTSRLTVEDCLALNMRDFTRKRVFSLPPGEFHSCEWSCRGTTAQTMFFRVDEIEGEIRQIWVVYRNPIVRAGQDPVLGYAIGIASRPCRYGGKRYRFLCPLVRNGIACGRRAERLFLPPGGQYFGCRACHDLTYRSAQQHDQRIDMLSKADALDLQFKEARKSNNYRKSLLLCRAFDKKRERFLKQFARLRVRGWVD
jgi:hypothetical protein